MNTSDPGPCVRSQRDLRAAPVSLSALRAGLLGLGLLGLGLLGAGGLAACAGNSTESPSATPAGAPSNSATAAPSESMTEATSSSSPDPASSDSAAAKTEIATFGAGCFWCVEAVLEQLDGVLDVTSGYMGGTVDDPSYRAVCTGTTGHAEVVQVTFDPTVIPYTHLLEWFWQLHDPTTLNRQGADTGTQYRSAIFYHSPEQQAAATASKAEAASRFSRPIVTEITAASTYWPAEEDHQDYYRLNSNAGYCRAVIQPKLDKLGLKK